LTKPIIIETKEYLENKWKHYLLIAWWTKVMFPHLKRWGIF
jgi:hypothetical protein